MKLETYISGRFSSIEEIDYIDLFIDGKYIGQHTASTALKGEHLALDPMEKGRKKSYCFPMNTQIKTYGGMVKFDYCGNNYEITMFKGVIENK